MKTTYKQKDLLQLVSEHRTYNLTKFLLEMVQPSGKSLCYEKSFFQSRKKIALLNDWENKGY